MNHSMADWLIYCFADHVDVPLVTALDCYFIDFHGLKEWFWEGKRRFAYDTTPGDNGAICRLVNIGDVCAAVWTMRYQLPV